MRKLFAVLIIIAIPVVSLVFISGTQMPIFSEIVGRDLPIVRVGNVPIRVEVADTPALRSKGLGGRDSLGATDGMLFIFETSGYHKIWMRDVPFVIDVLWVDEHFQVVDIVKGLRPDTFPRTFEPRAPARFVIETNGNYAESFGISIGDMVTLPREVVPEDLMGN